MIKKPTPAEDRQHTQLLHEVLLKRAPHLLPGMHRLGLEPLTDSDRDELRGVVLEEFLENGLRPDDEPTPYGVRLDDVIAWLGWK